MTIWKTLLGMALALSVSGCVPFVPII